jgi:hypothetical protein
MRPDSRPQTVDEFRAVLDTPTHPGRTIVPTGGFRRARPAEIGNRNLTSASFPRRAAFAAALFAVIAAGSVYLEQFGRRQAEAVRVASELSRKATERANREAAQRREVARWERAAARAAERLAQRKAVEIGRQRAIEAARRERQDVERRKMEALEQGRADTKRQQAEGAAQRRLTGRRARPVDTPLAGLRRLFLGALPR